MGSKSNNIYQNGGSKSTLTQINIFLSNIKHIHIYMPIYIPNLFFPSGNKQQQKELEQANDTLSRISGTADNCQKMNLLFLLLTDISEMKFGAAQECKAKIFTEIAHIYRDSGVIFRAGGAFEWYTKAQALTQPSSLLFAKIQLWISSCLEMSHQYESAYTNFVSAEKLLAGLSLSRLNYWYLSWAWLRQGTTQTKLCNYELARKHISNSMTIERDALWLAQQNMKQSALEIACSNLDNAQLHSLQALEIVRRTNGLLRIRASVQHAHALIAADDKNSALKLFVEARQNAQEMNYCHQVSAINNLLRQYGLDG